MALDPATGKSSMAGMNSGNRASLPGLICTSKPLYRTRRSAARGDIAGKRQAVDCRYRDRPGKAARISPMRQCRLPGGRAHFEIVAGVPIE
ncbi:MAG TPA: hypothetical protein VKB27_00455 [Gammaproteobacteria bacterium]|nr:hypothetical protein [Gammaproteobacteria bacterium]